MKKLLRLSLIGVALLITLLVTALYTPLGTKGLDIALRSFAGEFVGYRSLKGTIAKNLEITDLHIVTPALDIGADQILLHWNMGALVRSKLVVNSLEVDELLFSFKTRDNVAPQPESTEPFVLALPQIISPLLDIHLNSLVLRGIGFAVPGGRVVEHLDSALLSATIIDTELDIAELKVEDKAYGIALSGSALTGETWWADIAGSWRFSNWEGGELLGSLAAKGPLPDMDVKVELLAPTYVDIVGKMTGLPGNPYFDVVGKGDHTALPVVHHNIPDIRLDALVHAKGYVNDYTAELETTGEYWKFKGITARGTLWGNFDEIHFPTLQLKHQDTVVDLIGAYMDWDESFVVGGQVVPQNFNLGVMDERFAGDLSGLIDGKLTVEYGDDGDIYGWYSLKDVEGVVRGYPVKGGVDLSFTDTSLSLERIELFSGASHLLYKGNFEDEIDMSLVVKSSDIQELYPDGKGRLDVQASLKGSYENPKLSGTIAGRNIALLDVQIASIKGVAKNSVQKNGAYRLELDAQEIALYGEDARNGHLKLDGSLESHQGQLSLSRNEAALDVQFTGSLVDGVWKTLLKQGKLQHELFGGWQQQGQTTLVLDNEHLQFTDFVLKNQDAKLSAHGQYFFDELGPFAFSGLIENYYLSQLQTIAGAAHHPYEFTGKLNSSFTLQGNKQQLEKADVRLDTEGVTVAFPIDDIGGREEVVSQKGIFTGVFDGEKLKVSLKADVNQSEVVSELGILWQGRWDADPALMELSGRTSLNRVSLALLASQTNYRVESRGHVVGDFSYLGSLAKPVIQGDVDLVDGSIFLPEQGIELDGIKIGVQGDGDGLRVDGRVHSGGGLIRAKGLILYDADRGVTGKLTGKGRDFLVLDLPEYQIYASPDVQFSFDRNEMRIEGDVKIPKGKISSAENSIEAVRESDDVVIVDSGTGKQEKGYMVSAALRLDLGEEVEFSRFGITGRLAGELDIESSPTTPFRGSGEVSIVDGAFSAYGREFEIARGKVSYAGGPLINPGIDVRVQKQVRVQTGSMQGLYSTVGLDISGYANNINYTLFSSPYMEDADILSYLLLGHSLFSASDDESNILAEAASSFGWKRSASLITKIAAVLPVDDVHLESGAVDHDMSVVVGKNITKDLYVGYDYNVLDQLGEVLLRYNLKYGFFIESTTSQESTGADLLYIFER